jgi:hypothetical protein
MLYRCCGYAVLMVRKWTRVNTAERAIIDVRASRDEVLVVHDQQLGVNEGLSHLPLP